MLLSLSSFELISHYDNNDYYEHSHHHHHYKYDYTQNYNKMIEHDWLLFVMIIGLIEVQFGLS